MLLGQVIYAHMNIQFLVCPEQNKHRVSETYLGRCVFKLSPCIFHITIRLFNKLCVMEIFLAVSRKEKPSSIFTTCFFFSRNSQEVEIKYKLDIFIAKKLNERVSVKNYESSRLASSQLQGHKPKQLVSSFFFLIFPSCGRGKIAKRLSNSS